MKKIVILTIIFLLASLQGGSLNAEYNPITKSENILIQNSKSPGLALLASDTAVNPAELSGLTDSDLIEAAITEAETSNRIVQIPPVSPLSGDMWLLDRSIEVPTNFTLILNNCYLKLKPGVNDNIIRTANIDDLSLANDIYVIGLGNATVDGNGINQTTNMDIYKRIGVLFFNVDGFEVSGFKVKNTHGWGMSFESGCCNGEIWNIEIDQDGLVLNQDGIDIRDGCHHIKIHDITGTADDDCIALTALANNVMQVVNDGSKGTNIHDIEIYNISMKSNYCNIIDLICHDGRKNYNINIHDIYDTSDVFQTRSLVGAVVVIGNFDFAPFSLVRPAQDGELHNININNINGRGMYLVRFGWFSNNVHISNLNARDDFDYVFRSYNARHLAFTVRDVYVDGVYADQLQYSDASTPLTPANWRGVVFDFLDGDIQNFNAKNVNIGSCKNVIVLNPTATMSKYCHFSNFDISTTSHQIYSIQNDNAKIILDNWTVPERNDIYISDTNKRGQFYTAKQYENSIINIGVGMPKVLPIDATANTTYATEAPIMYYVNATNGSDIHSGTTSQTAFRTIQKAIDMLPKKINHLVTVTVAAGTYSEDVLITGFNGSSYIVINGAGVVADTHRVNSITSINNVAYIRIDGFKLISATTSSISATRCSGIDINNCKIINTSSFPAITYNASFGSVGACEISNKFIGIYSTMFAGVYSQNNTGNNNTYGLVADKGATIVKQSTQPSAVSAEYTEGGTIK